MLFWTPVLEYIKIRPSPISKLSPDALTYVLFSRKQIIQRVNGRHIYQYVYVRIRHNISIQSAYLFKHRMTESDLCELFQFEDYKTFSCLLICCDIGNLHMGLVAIKFVFGVIQTNLLSFKRRVRILQFCT